MHKVRFEVNIVVVPVGVVKIYVGGAQGKGKRGSKLDETQFGIKKMAHF
jgi:hypothetical protein